MSTGNEPLPIIGDPGEVFKEKAAQVMQGAPGFTPFELIYIAWIIAQAIIMLRNCHRNDPAAAVRRAMNPGRIDKARLWLLIKQSGYSGSPSELAERLKLAAAITTESEMQHMWNSGELPVL